MLFICSVGEDSWECLGPQGDPASPSWRISVLNILWKDWCWSWNSNTLAPWCKELTHLKRPWYWERLKVEGDDRGWDGWMASPPPWTWVWVKSWSWWWTGRPVVLQSMGSQRVGHDWATELNWMKIMATSFKRSCARTDTLSSPNPAAGHCPPMTLLETPGHSQASLGQSIVWLLLLSPGSWFAQGFVCALQESISPVLCKFWQLCGRVSGSLLQEGLATPRSATPRATVPVACHSWPLPPQGTFNQRQVWLSLCGVSWCTQGFIFEPSESLWQVWGLILNVMLPLLPSFWGFSFALGCGVSFFGGIQHSPVVACSAASCNFGVLAGLDEPMPFYSAILWLVIGGS